MIVRVRLLAGTALLALAMAACGGADTAAQDGEPTEAAAPATTAAEESTTAPATDDAATAPATDETAAATEEATDAEATQQAAGEVTVMVSESDLGEILVDGEGMTLYLFTNDTEDSSACYDDCAATWPPLEGEATAGEGVDEALLGTIERDDGSTQVTYGGHPLYYFAPDEASGDINGQGVGGVWFVVDPAGEPIEETASADAGLEY